MINKVLGFFNLKYFLISFAVGVLYIYLTEDYKKVIILYPTPDNVDKYVYVDKSKNCFNYDLQKVDCPKNKKEYIDIKVNY
tara:strand:+ start:3952 stop:4194 length:243 start_codon:yes stop_codon:yes gene_type:complete